MMTINMIRLQQQCYTNFDDSVKMYRGRKMTCETNGSCSVISEFIYNVFLCIIVISELPAVEMIDFVPFNAYRMIDIR